jgi:hypothetical protein
LKDIEIIRPIFNFYIPGYRGVLICGSWGGKEKNSEGIKPERLSSKLSTVKDRIAKDLMLPSKK